MNSVSKLQICLQTKILHESCRVRLVDNTSSLAKLPKISRTLFSCYFSMATDFKECPRFGFLTGSPINPNKVVDQVDLDKVGSVMDN